MRKSPIHGRGIFAKRNIVEGEAVALDPADGYNMFVNDRTSELVQGIWHKNWATCDTWEKFGDLAKWAFGQYMFDLDSLSKPNTHFMIISADPLKEEGWYLGHLANTSCLSEPSIAGAAWNIIQRDGGIDPRKFPEVASEVIFYE